jgi:hypothetical protein
MADTEALLHQTLSEHAGRVAAPPDLLHQVRTRSRRRRHARVITGLASAAAIAGLSVVAAGLALPDRTERIATEPTSPVPVERCQGVRMGQTVLEGPGSEELADRLRTALRGRWQEDRARPACRQPAPGYAPFGGQVTRSAAVPFTYSDGTSVPPTIATLVEHDQPTPEAVAEQYARDGGPTRIELGPGQTLAPDLVFDNRLLAESRPDAGSHIWVYETLQTVCGVLWTSNGTTALVLAFKGGDINPNAVSVEVEAALTTLAGQRDN